MARISDYDGTDFITIENGTIIWNGFFYSADGYITLLEYSRFETSIDDFITKYGRSADEAYEEYGVRSTQYVTQEGEGDNTTNYMENLLDSWVNEARPLTTDEIDADTPNGFYVLR